MDDGKNEEFAPRSLQEGPLISEGQRHEIWDRLKPLNAEGQVLVISVAGVQDRFEDWRTGKSWICEEE